GTSTKSKEPGNSNPSRWVRSGPALSCRRQIQSGGHVAERRPSSWRYAPASSHARKHVSAICFPKRSWIFGKRHLTGAAFPACEFRASAMTGQRPNGEERQRSLSDNGKRNPDEADCLLFPCSRCPSVAI